MPSPHALVRDPAPSSPDPAKQPSGGRRIVIISASVGAGHDGAAAQIARRLVASGFRVDRLDFVDLLPAQLGKLLRAGYHHLLVAAPAGYQRIYATTERARRPGPIVRALLRSSESRTLRALPSDTCAIVSTHHAASQVLGAMRLRGSLTVPALTYLTDFSVHPLWVAPGVDAHMALHEIPAAQARAQGATAVAVTGPVVDPAFGPAMPPERQMARARFGLPEREPLALLVAGSWGVGSVREAAAEILSCGVATPVVVCGRNRVLADRLTQDGVEHAYGWVDDMPGLMRACDILVQNAGGLTSLEAFASGLPVASYRCIPGHGQTNAAALDEAGLATWIRGPDQLEPVLAALLDGTLGNGQRAEAEALFRSCSSLEHTVATAVAGETVTARTRTARRTAWRRIRLVAATVALMLCLGISTEVVEDHASAHVGPAMNWIKGHRR